MEVFTSQRIFSYQTEIYEWSYSQGLEQLCRNKLFDVFETLAFADLPVFENRDEKCEVELSEISLQELLKILLDCQSFLKHCNVISFEQADSFRSLSKVLLNKVLWEACKWTLRIFSGIISLDLIEAFEKLLGLVYLIF